MSMPIYCLVILRRAKENRATDQLSWIAAYLRTPQADGSGLISTAQHHLLEVAYLAGHARGCHNEFYEFSKALPTSRVNP